MTPWMKWRKIKEKKRRNNSWWLSVTLNIKSTNREKKIFSSSPQTRTEREREREKIDIDKCFCTILVYYIKMLCCSRIWNEMKNEQQNIEFGTILNHCNRLKVDQNQKKKNEIHKTKQNKKKFIYKRYTWSLNKQHKQRRQTITRICFFFSTLSWLWCFIRKMIKKNIDYVQCTIGDCKLVKK